ncbi:hypothetical protein HGRIS_001849 [Hohenbuehelia grisea]|uniref:Uncharacterized protein n=1 Tax=Hohenbuehelia grisea TaxID=104357 RepID=A0ABR3JJ27_9AGAR
MKTADGICLRVRYSHHMDATKIAESQPIRHPNSFSFAEANDSSHVPVDLQLQGRKVNTHLTWGVPTSSISSTSSSKTRSSIAPPPSSATSGSDSAHISMTFQHDRTPDYDFYGEDIEPRATSSSNSDYWATHVPQTQAQLAQAAPASFAQAGTSHVAQTAAFYDPRQQVPAPEKSHLNSEGETSMYSAKAEDLDSVQLPAMSPKIAAPVPVAFSARSKLALYNLLTMRSSSPTFLNNQGASSSSPTLNVYCAPPEGPIETTHADPAGMIPQMVPHMNYSPSNLSLQPVPAFQSYSGHNFTNESIGASSYDQKGSYQTASTEIHSTYSHAVYHQGGSQQNLSMGYHSQHHQAIDVYGFYPPSTNPPPTPETIEAALYQTAAHVPSAHDELLPQEGGFPGVPLHDDSCTYPFSATGSHTPAPHLSDSPVGALGLIWDHPIPPEECIARLQRPVSPSFAEALMHPTLMAWAYES